MYYVKSYGVAAGVYIMQDTMVGRGGRLGKNLNLRVKGKHEKGERKTEENYI